MTGSERARRVFKRERTDRVATFDILANPAVCEYMTGKSYEADPYHCTIGAMNRLGIDCGRIVWLPIKEAPPGWVVDMTGYGMYREIKEIQALENIPDWAARFPRAEKVRHTFDFEKASQRHRKLMERMQNDFGAETLYIPTINPPLTDLQVEIGAVLFFQGLLLYPEEMQHVIDSRYETAICEAEVIAQARIATAVFVADDIAYNSGPMIRPALLEKIFFPNLKRVCEPLLAAGIVPVYHTDGYVWDLIPLLYSAGIRGLHPNEPHAGNSLRKMKQDWGERLMLFGNVCCLTTLPFGKPEDVRRDVQHCIEDGASGGGYFLGSSSCLGPDIPKENIVAMFEAVQEYGRY